MNEECKSRIREFSEPVHMPADIAASGDYFHSEGAEEMPLPGQGTGLAGREQTLAALSRTSNP